MKKLILLTSLVLSSLALADMVHQTGNGVAPSSDKLNLAHQCFSEAITAGCRSPREDRANFRECVRDNAETFSSDCQAFVTRIYGKK